MDERHDVPPEGPYWWREHIHDEFSMMPPAESHLDHIASYDITTLNPEGHRLGAVRVRDLTANHRVCATLTSLNLSSNGIKDEEAVWVAANMHVLRKLNVADNLLRLSGAKALAACSSLSELDISRNVELSVDGMVAILGSTSITRLIMKSMLRSSQFLDLRIAQAIAENTILVALSLTDCAVSDEGVELIAQNRSITHLDLSCGSRNSFSQRGARALSSNTTLKHLNVSRCRIGTEAVMDLLTSRNLTSLNLSMVPALNSGVCIPLAVNTTLQCLKIIGTAPLEAAMPTLLSGRNTNLTRLKLSQPIGMKAAHALAANTTLRRLCLDSSVMDDEAAKVIASNSTLTRLSLKGVDIGKEGLRALSEMPSVTRLCLSQWPQGAALDFSLAVPVLATNPTLKFLELTQTTWTRYDGLVALATNSTLTSLRLNYASLNDEELAALAKNSTLRSLDLSCSRITNEEHLPALLGSSTLTSLNLSNIRLSSRALALLQSATHLKHLNLYPQRAEDDDMAIARTMALRTNLTSLKLSEEGSFPVWPFPVALYLARNQRIANECDALRKANMIGKVTGEFQVPTLLELGVAAVTRRDWPLSELVARVPRELASRFQRHDDELPT